MTAESSGMVVVTVSHCLSLITHIHMHTHTGFHTGFLLGKGNTHSLVLTTPTFIQATPNVTWTAF